MQTSTSSSSSTAVAVVANGAESSTAAAAKTTTSDEFEAIFNQMTALVSTIDEELEHSAASTKQRSSAGGAGGESTSTNSSANSTTTTANSLKMKSLGSSGGPEFYHHLNHHHQFSHYHSQSLDDPHHPTIITSSSSTTTTTNGHRTDSPDADSAFSDSISLVSSTEQSSSSSSSSSTTSSTSGKCSSASSNGVQPQHQTPFHHQLHHHHNSPSTSSSSLPIPPPPPPSLLSPPSLINSSNVVNGFVPLPNSPLNLTAINSTSSTMLSEKLMNSCNIGTSPSLSSTTSSGTISATSTTSTSSSSNLDHQLMALNQQQELFFEQLGRCTTSASEANQKQSSLLKSPSKSEKHSGKGFDGKKGGKNEDNEDDDAQFCQRNSNSTSFYDIFSALLLSHRDSINFNVNDDEDSEDSESEDVNGNSLKNPLAKDSQEEEKALQMSSNSSDFDQTSTVVKFSSTSVDNESCSSTVVNVKSSAPPHCDIAKFRENTKKTDKELAVEENIRAAMAKIREATFRKLYLKVFAQDNSAKSLLADERMNIGAICGQLAAKNHISLDSSLCIIEHMPHLYLERFFEDHESLVENVLHWGRDSANKLYFMQRADKYDLFHRPERYLISSSSTENTSTKNSSSSSSNDSTLKSSSGPASEFLRRDLIQQFFNSSQNSGANKVPEVEGELYLRAEGKKTWKKYFFTLRSSGLYYCPTGKLDKNGGQKPSPKSTKELLCLATFDLNSVYLGFGWKKKFKAPTDFGFALKHPQVQAKAPKHIKYLCAENEDQLRLWLTGVRIAKYGRQLWSNWEAFRQEGTNTGKSSEEEKLSKPSANFDSSEYYHQQSTQSVTMRSNRNGLNRDESARSSSTSSASSGCLSEGVASTGSGTTSVSNPGVHHQLNHHLNFHHHHQNGGLVSPMDGGSLHYLGSPTHNNGNFGHFASSASNQPQSTMSLSALPHFPQNSSSSGFDTDSFPLGTIKRKPSVQSMPKIPLTKNTRNLALQSEDVLLEHEGEAEGTAYDPHMMIGSHSVDHDQQIYSGTGISEVVSPFQRGTFLSGTLRRSTTEERMRANKNNQNNNNFNQMMMMNSSSVLNSSSPLHLPNPASIVQTPHLPHVNGNVSSYLAPPPAPINVNSKSDSEDELPLPPPPPLKESESTLSLASATAAASSNSVSFPPPPPMEVLQPSSPILQQNIQQQNFQQTPAVSTISTAAAVYGSMTPQPQPKNGARLNRRLSDLSSNSTFFLNNNGSNSFNNRNGVQQPQEFNFNQQQQFPQSPQSPSYHLMAANSRASIATSGESNSSGLYGPSAGFVTLKPYHNRGASISGSSLNGNGLMNSRHHRQLTLDLNAALNKYGTAPRLRNTDQQQLLATMARDYEVQNQNLNLNQNGGSTFNGGVSSPSSPSLPPPNSSIYQSSNNSPSSYHHQNSIPFNSNQYNVNNETMLPPPQQQQSHPQMLYQQQQSYLLNGQSLPSPPPPPPPVPQNFQANSAITSRPSTNENVIYMSISPHLLQKHQAMAVVNDVYQAHQQPIYGPTPITTPTLSPSLPPPPPPEQIFLKSMERVMAKKWHVAQMLRSTESEYYGSTPGQVLGFRDPAYLPPREQQVQQQQQTYQQQMAYQQTAPPQAPPQMPYYPYQQQQGPPGPIYQQQQQMSQQQSHPTYQPEMPINQQQQQQQIYGTQQGAQQIYAGGSSLGKRVPPPPPKRSENTHLTLGQQQQQQSSRR